MVTPVPKRMRFVRIAQAATNRKLSIEMLRPLGKKSPSKPSSSAASARLNSSEMVGLSMFPCRLKRMPFSVFPHSNYTELRIYSLLSILRSKHLMSRSPATPRVETNRIMAASDLQTRA